MVPCSEGVFAPWFTMSYLENCASTVCPLSISAMSMCAGGRWHPVSMKLALSSATDMAAFFFIIECNNLPVRVQPSCNVWSESVGRVFQVHRFYKVCR